MARVMGAGTGVDRVWVRYGALLAGDMLAAARVLDDASILHVPGRSGLAGDYQGREAIMGFFSRMAEYTHNTLRFGSSRLVAEDSRVLVVQGHMSATAAGTQLDTDVIYALSLRGDKIQEVWLFSLNQEDFDEFWTGR
ncbi:MAG: nuclear transport factor 2 family protein [Actinomycetota bacterium]|nr:nuclear transport factor 2 family protein [Actinomycetota bacterium]